MNLPENFSAANARLPQTYESAKAALSECTRLDECKDWSDKAQAFASYARQANDEQLMKMAMRIRARAGSRASEIYSQLEAGTKHNAKKQSKDDLTLISRTEAAREAGWSVHQQRELARIGNVPEDEREALIESDNPPTLSQLAALGTKKRKNIIDLKGRDPKEFKLAMHYVAAFESALKALTKQSHDKIIPTLNEGERDRVRKAIEGIDAINDTVVTRI